MRKEKEGKTLKFYDVELHSTPAEYYECLHIEDPDITEDHIWKNMSTLPYQESNVTWVTGNGVFRMFGKIAKPYYLSFRLCHKDDENE